MGLGRGVRGALLPGDTGAGRRNQSCQADDLPGDRRRGIACVVGGLFADRFGKAETTIVILAVSGTAALLTAFTFAGRCG